MKNKVLLTALMLIMCFSLLISIPPMAYAVGTAHEVADAITLGTALGAYQSGDTIKLMADITYNNEVTITRDLTIDLNGKTLLMENFFESEDNLLLMGHN